MSTCRSDLKVATWCHGRALAGIKANEKQAVAIAKPRMSTRELTSNELVDFGPAWLRKLRDAPSVRCGVNLTAGAVSRVSGRRFSMDFVGSDLGFLRSHLDWVRHNARYGAGRSRGNGRRLWLAARGVFAPWFSASATSVAASPSRRWIRRRHRRGQRRRRHGGRRRVVCASSTRGGEGERARRQEAVRGAAAPTAIPRKDTLVVATLQVLPCETPERRL